MSGVFFAFLLTLMAGLATGLGGCLVFFVRVEDKRALAVCLSFAAGVMLYISFAEILLKGFEDTRYWMATLAFFGGVGGMALFDRLLPRREGDLQRTGAMSAVAIGVHNFPEGVLTFLAAMYDPMLGAAVAMAVALHNIPEGIAMAAPLYYATGRKGKALGVALASGLAEPLGGLVAWLMLRRFVGEVDASFGLVFAAVGGIMVYVALAQLLPAAFRYGKERLVVGWLFAGMVVMAVSLVAMEAVFGNG